MTLRHRLLSADFPARLRKARLQAGLTQAELGQAVGYADKQGLGAVEKGRRGCTTELCCRLGEVLQISAAKLAYGEDVPACRWQDYGARLREVRQAEGLSIRAAAVQLGYRGVGGLGGLETERNRLDIAQAEMIARIYGVLPAWLAFGVGERDRR